MTAIHTTLRKMKIKTILPLIALFVALISCNNNKLVINGTTQAPDITSIILLKPGQDIRFDSVIEIPVVDGKFHYETTLEYPEGVDLVLGSFRENGGGRFMPLFLENENIDLTIYSEEDFDNNTVNGGMANRQYLAYNEQMEELFGERFSRLTDSLNHIYEKEEKNNHDLEVLQERLEKTNDPEEKDFILKQVQSIYKHKQYLTGRLEALSEERRSIYREQEEFKRSYIEQNLNMVSYYLLLQELIYNEENTDSEWARKILGSFTSAYPGHPYNTLATNLVSAMENIREGKSYLNFTAPDLDGNLYNLSEIIQGKVALLDLWATWCAPCIAKSRKMLPVYEEFKDRGFTVVGVAGEFKNTDRLERFLQKEQWPWLNLVELDRKNGIWQQYGVDGGGGGMFLIGVNGEILAKDPSAEEVRALLESKI